jgi:hypothetical protein
MMKGNTNKVIFVIILIVAVFASRLYYHPGHAPVYVPESHSAGSTTSGTSSGIGQSLIDPHAHLIYTRHARCRMDCRHISEADIREVLREGHVNAAKSQQNQSPCPTFAIEEDRHSDGVRLRVVFARCENETKVVTCIDRDHEYQCDCK